MVPLGLVICMAKSRLIMPGITVLSHICTDVKHPSLMLQTRDGKRYIFGRIAEGFQRTLNQKKIRRTKLAGIFLTGSLEWESVGGLPGYLLSLNEQVGAPRVIHTGIHSQAEKVINSWRRFITHAPLQIGVTSEVFRDTNVEIRPVVLGGDSTSYVLQMLPTRGKFLVDKAKALGVPAGKLFADLSAGRSVTTPESRIVHPEEVLGTPPKPSRVLIIDAPEQRHLSEAIESAEWLVPLKRKREVLECDVVVRVIYCFLGEKVDPEELQHLSNKFPNAKLFISHPDFSPDWTTLDSFCEFENALKSELPKHFSALHSAPAKKPDTELCVGRPMVIGQTQGLIEPLKFEDASLADCREVTATAPQKVAEPEVVTLGTGASAPSKYRNVSSTLVRLPSGKAIMFDCGEGTWGTLGRLYGPQGAKDVLRELEALYISHMHADHHLGTLSVVQQWLKVNPTGTLILLGPRGLALFINDWADEIETNRIKFVDLETTVVGQGYQGRVSEEQRSKASSELGFSVETCRAIHCPYSYNVAITYDSNSNNNGFKVAYSGDTRPNPFFAKIGQHCDLLIHEATHGDDLQEDAVSKRHSTISEALDIANQMNARNVVLTHISQRYPRLPELPTVMTSCFGFDCMRSRLSEINDLRMAIPKIRELITDDE